MLTMQGDAGKRAIIAEACRVLAPGGRYAVHELGLKPDDVAADVKEDVRRSLAKAFKANARLLTMAEWREPFEIERLSVQWYANGEMALLQPRRLLEDEGPAGVARMARTMLRDPELRRQIFTRNKHHLCAVALMATRRD